jgi:hypothetical protein
MQPVLSTIADSTPTRKVTHRPETEIAAYPRLAALFTHLSESFNRAALILPALMSSLPSD